MAEETKPCGRKAPVPRQAESPPSIRTSSWNPQLLGSKISGHNNPVKSSHGVGPISPLLHRGGHRGSEKQSPGSHHTRQQQSQHLPPSLHPPDHEATRPQDAPHSTLWSSHVLFSDEETEVEGGSVNF